MRHRDLFGVCILISVILVYLIKYLLPMAGIKIGIVANLSSPLIASFVIAPLLLILLFPINNKFRDWRKKNGRDIDAEERHETEYGMTKLTPNDDRNTEDQNDVQFYR